jgi:hypothetical protein
MGTHLRAIWLGGWVRLDHMALACLPGAVAATIAAARYEAGRDGPTPVRAISAVFWLVCFASVLEPYIVWVVRWIVGRK